MLTACSHWVPAPPYPWPAAATSCCVRALRSSRSGGGTSSPASCSMSLMRPGWATSGCSCCRGAAAKPGGSLSCCGEGGCLWLEYPLTNSSCCVRLGSCCCCFPCCCCTCFQAEPAVWRPVVTLLRHTYRSLRGCRWQWFEGRCGRPPCTQQLLLP